MFRACSLLAGKIEHQHVHALMLTPRPSCSSRTRNMQVYDERVLVLMQGFADAKRVTNMWCKSPCYMLRIARADMHDLLQQYPQLLDTLKSLNLERRNNSKAA